MQRRFRDWINAYLQYTEETEAPRMFRTWTAISTVASALQRKCFIDWGPELTWYPNLYVVLVAPSGRRKGVAMKPSRRLIDDVGIKIAAEAVTREMLIRELSGTTTFKVDMETGKTITHSSLTVHSQELTVFLGYNNQQLMADLCDWFDCGNRWVYRTKTQGEDDIIGVWLNLLGATTPTLIKESLPQDAIGGGLTSRIIFVYESTKGRSIARPRITEALLDLRESLKVELEKIASMHGEFEPSEEFCQMWEEWYLYQESNPPFNEERLEPYLTRRPMHLMKLAMISNASRTDAMVLEAEDFDRARALLEATEVKMPLVFKGFGKSDLSGIIGRVSAYLAIRGGATKSELMQIFLDDADSTTLDRVITTLTVAKFIRTERIPQTSEIKIDYIGPQEPKEGDLPTCI